MKRSFHSAFTVQQEHRAPSSILDHHHHHQQQGDQLLDDHNNTQNNNHNSNRNSVVMVDQSDESDLSTLTTKRCKISSRPSHIMTMCVTNNFNNNFNNFNSNNNNNNNSNNSAFMTYKMQTMQQQKCRVDSRWDYTNTQHVQHLNFLKHFTTSSAGTNFNGIHINCGEQEQQQRQQNSSPSLMHLTICSMNGKKMIVALDKQEATVYDLKQSIMRKMNIAPERQLLLFEGKLLNDPFLNLYHDCKLRTGHAVQVMCPQAYRP